MKDMEDDRLHRRKSKEKIKWFGDFVSQIVFLECSSIVQKGQSLWTLLHEDNYCGTTNGMELTL